MAEAVLTRRSVVKNEYQLLADITVSSATTQVDITGLNIGKDEEIVLVVDFVNASGSTSNLYGYVNDNVTDTNYYTQVLQATGTTVASVRNPQPAIMNNSASSRSLAIIKIKLTNNGYFVFQTSNNRDYGGSAIQVYEYYGTSTFTLTSITKLSIIASIANSIGIGSRFQLYKVAKWVMHY